MTADLPDLLRRRRKKRSLWARTAYLTGAAIAFVAGLVGWLIPFVTGIPFYLVGIVLLGMASDRALGAINRLERSLPTGFRVKLRRTLGKIPSRRLRGLINLPPVPADRDRRMR